MSEELEEEFAEMVEVAGHLREEVKKDEEILEDIEYRLVESLQLLEELEEEKGEKLETILKKAKKNDVRLSTSAEQKITEMDVNLSHVRTELGNLLERDVEEEKELEEVLEADDIFFRKIRAAEELIEETS